MSVIAYIVITPVLDGGRCVSLKRRYIRFLSKIYRITNVMNGYNFILRVSYAVGINIQAITLVK